MLRGAAVDFSLVASAAETAGFEVTAGAGGATLAGCGVRPADASGCAEDLLLERPCDGDALVRLSDGAAQVLREMVRVHDESLGTLFEEMIEDVKKDRPAPEQEERFGRCACFGAETRAETGREDEGDHPA